MTDADRRFFDDHGYSGVSASQSRDPYEGYVRLSRFATTVPYDESDFETQAVQQLLDDDVVAP